MNNKEFGIKLNSIRKERGVTAEKLAEDCNMSVSFLRHIMGGSKSLSIDMMLRLCNVLQVSPDYLLKSDLNLSDAEIKKNIHYTIDSLSPNQLLMFQQILNSLIEYTK